ncbi:MAG: DNA polymerase III subunit delta' [Mycobacteriaceae bacterium]
MAGVFDRLVGQHEVETELIAAAIAAGWGDDLGGSGMTHAWLFTGPPGSGRSIAALCFAAALECTNFLSGASEHPGCGQCQGCLTVMAGTHADVRRVVPEGLSIGVDEMRSIVQMASRRPSTGRWQVVVIEDADRLTEGAANALLKVVEEPPARTVFLLCAPSVDPQDISVTLKSRCRHVALVTPSVEAIAQVLRQRDGLDDQSAYLAAAISGGHVGRARRLATDEQARQRRIRALRIPREAMSARSAYASAEELVKSAEEEAKALGAVRDEAETEALRIALGAGGTGKGAAGAIRGSAGALKDLERKQKSRMTRAGRDALDRTLIDLAGFYRDALAASLGAKTTATHPDVADQVTALAQFARSEDLLICIEAVLGCREALAANVKPKWAVDAMVATLGSTLRR